MATQLFVFNQACKSHKEDTRNTPVSKEKTGRAARFSFYSFDWKQCLLKFRVEFVIPASGYHFWTVWLLWDGAGLLIPKLQDETTLLMYLVESATMHPPVQWGGSQIFCMALYPITPSLLYGPSVGWLWWHWGDVRSQWLGSPAQLMLPHGSGQMQKTNCVSFGLWRSVGLWLVEISSALLEISDKTRH